DMAAGIVAVAEDPIGNVWSTGYYRVQGGTRISSWIRKYSLMGEILWEQALTNSDGDDIVPRALFLDDDCTAHFVGAQYATVEDEGVEYESIHPVVIKLSPADR